MLVFRTHQRTIDSAPAEADRFPGILGQSPSDVMCASSRMVVKRQGADGPAVLACTLLPYDEAFELGGTLAEHAGLGAALAAAGR